MAQKENLTEFEEKLKEIFRVTDSNAKDIGKELLGIAFKQFMTFQNAVNPNVTADGQDAVDGNLDNPHVDYEWKYKLALERMKYWMNNGAALPVETFVFPELAEYSDAKAREDILDYCNKRLENKSERITIGRVEMWKTWVEKQKQPMWNVDDQEKLYEIIYRMEALDHFWNRPTDERLIKWLKSIKQRMINCL